MWINKKKKRKKTYRLVDFAVPANHRLKIKEDEQIDKYLDLARELKNPVEQASDGDTNCNWCAWNGPEEFGRGIGTVGNSSPFRLQHCWDWPEYWEKSWRPEDSYCHSDCSIVEIGQNTEKSPGGLRIVIVTQTAALLRLARILRRVLETWG